MSKNRRKCSDLLEFRSTSFFVDCGSLVGMMASLKELTLNDTGAEDLPDSVRSSRKLELF